ncbi:MAG: recombinase family protein [Leptolyngbyaceae cyanobacterium SM1_1_3]|nr:recombinase family protein [Leptolyngbyaceae cyanobacterium SM1_1_3]NJN02345.1 recombinase family protein [Leptolyngbyaceae cyanobacterium RM1_1_2]NJO11725.1 recombinase family protein [Leptolyngbyaceae cyanobacterium SL_1_1]
MPSTVGYCRVSSREPSDNTAALEQQKARVKEAGAEEILVDVESGRSGREDERPEFQRLMHLVEQQRVEKVIVTRLDNTSYVPAAEQRLVSVSNSHFRK